MGKASWLLKTPEEMVPSPPLGVAGLDEMPGTAKVILLSV